VSEYDPKATRRDLLRWYRAHRRDLPWRRTRDPYAIWISEAMLQQTRVETAIPYYHRFLERFPDVEALASADLDDVLGAWAGLGYYTRARNLQKAARVVVDSHAGALPDDAEALRSLPGVGRYTAGAVASIAFDRPEPVVDGNVIRVLTRLRGIREDVKKAPVARRLWEEAELLVKGRSPGDFNQALMELGATLCSPRAPRCLACPLASHCAAHASGDPESLPVKAPKAAPKRVEAVAGWVIRRGKALAVRRKEDGLLAGMWDLPGGELLGGEAPGDGLVRSLRERLGLAVEGAVCAGSVEHIFTHRRMRLHVFRCEGVSGRVKRRGFSDHRWVSASSLRELPQGALTRKALALVASDGA
jgi:A/G-specific adenine glycosylase